MSPLRIEVFSTEIQEWRLAGEIGEGMPPGSMSDNHEHGRDVYFFGIDELHKLAYIRKAAPGIDIEEGGLRGLSPLEGTVVMELQDGESHEMTMQSDKSPQPRQLRFTYIK